MDGGGGHNHGSNWAEIKDDPLEVICKLSDPISMSRMSYSVRDLHSTLERVAYRLPSFAYDLPCLLHTNPFTWPEDKSEEGKIIEASLMPLEGPSITSPIILPKESCRWAGYRRNWVAVVVCNDRLK